MGGASSTVDSLLADCAKLTPEERRRLFDELSRSYFKESGARATIKSWNDGSPSPEYTASAPSQSSRPVVMDLGEECSSDDVVTGCPWCRRPVTVSLYNQDSDSSMVSSSSVEGDNGRVAYVALIYGPACVKYFLGALVLGWGLKQHAGTPRERILLYTSDVPREYLSALTAVGWTCRQVEYIKSVAHALFHSPKTSRFRNIFTKLRALELVEYQKVLCLDIDLLVRKPSDTEEANLLDSLFSLEAPAAMKRGNPYPEHGDRVAYCDFWTHPTRRAIDQIPVHQQVSGINAGVMLLKPDMNIMSQMEAEVRDWHHPQHFPTYMPEQEYLSRYYGTFERWTHIDCRFNFEIDKNERVFHDVTRAYERIVEDGTGTADRHPGAIVLHYSGSEVKPWEVLFNISEVSGAEDRKWCSERLIVSNLEELMIFRKGLTSEVPQKILYRCKDKPRMWAAILEWIEQLEHAAAFSVREVGLDPIAIAFAPTE